MTQDNHEEEKIVLKADDIASQNWPGWQMSVLNFIARVAFAIDRLFGWNSSRKR
jgi:hypothetical protein